MGLETLLKKITHPKETFSKGESKERTPDIEVEYRKLLEEYQKAFSVFSDLRPEDSHLGNIVAALEVAGKKLKEFRKEHNISEPSVPEYGAGK